MQYRFRFAVGVLVVTLLLAAVAGCGAGGGADPLADSTWKLVAWGDPTVLPAEVEITAQFSEGQIAGNAGVNSYFGAYTVNGEGLTTGELGRTLMAGPEPAMRAEDTYLSLLAEVRSYDLAGDMLMLNDADDNALLQFERVSP